MLWLADHERSEIWCWDTQQRVAAIKMKAALEKAREAAQSQAASLNGQSLKDAFGETKTVVESGQFSWLTLGYLTNGRPQLSQVPGVEYAGNDFMRSVFELQQGEAGVAINNPETTAYLVYIKTDESNRDRRKRCQLWLGSSSSSPLHAMLYIVVKS